MDLSHPPRRCPRSQRKGWGLWLLASPSPAPGRHKEGDCYKSDNGLSDSRGKESTCSAVDAEETRVWAGKMPCRRARQPTPVFLPGESHGQRSLLGYSPWGRKELDMTEHAHGPQTCRANQAREDRASAECGGTMRL